MRAAACIPGQAADAGEEGAVAQPQEDGGEQPGQAGCPQHPPPPSGQDFMEAKRGANASSPAWGSGTPPQPGPYPAAPALRWDRWARPSARGGFGVTGVPWVHPAAASLPHLRAEPRWRRSPKMSRDGSKPHGKPTQVTVLPALFACLSFPHGARMQPGPKPPSLPIAHQGFTSGH